MTRFLTSKLLVMLGLMLLFVIGLGSIKGLVRERQYYHQQVMDDIGNQYVRAQTLATPFLVIPVTTQHACPQDAKQTCPTTSQIILTPHQSTWQHQVQVSTDNFKRGIYRAITYQDSLHGEGAFVLPAALTTPEPDRSIAWDKAELRLPVSDLRGLASPPVMDILGQSRSLDFPADDQTNDSSTPNHPFGTAYLQTALKLDSSHPQIPFTLHLSLNGMGSLAMIPLGQSMSMTMDADWPYPSFFGGALPQKQRDNQRFSAAWQSSYLNQQNNQLLNLCFNGNSPASCQTLETNAAQTVTCADGDSECSHANSKTGSDVNSSAFAVSFVEGVNGYTMTDRTIKYGLIFLLITFGTFFLFEVLKRLAVHPMQYGLVAAGLGVFYLLLLSFSEHIGFAAAYLGSSIACIGLISFYVYFVLERLSRTLLLTTILSLMYGAMYVILQSEDYTLILGSCLIFMLLAIVMVLTRKVDWYQLKGLGAGAPQGPFPPALPTTENPS